MGCAEFVSVSAVNPFVNLHLIGEMVFDAS